MNSDLKAGFTRLLRSFDDNPDDVVKITRAFGIATKAYKRQHSIDKYEHYLGHSLRVALILAEELKIHDIDLVCAALLHDAQISNNDMKEFGERVYYILSTIDSWAKEKASEEYFAKMTKAPKDSRYIKLAERLDDIRSMKGQTFKDKVTKKRLKNMWFQLQLRLTTS